MAISFVSSASASSNTVAMPSHQAGDLIIVFAARNNNATAPGLASGYTNIVNGGQVGNTSVSLRVGWKIAESGSESTGTWTNANRVSVHVYRGAEYRSTSATNGSTGGATYPALSGLDATDWGLRYAVTAGSTPSLPSGWTSVTTPTNTRTSHDGPIGGSSISSASAGGSFGNGSIAVTIAIQEPPFVSHEADAELSVTATRTAAVAQGFTATAPTVVTANRSATVAYTATAVADLGITGLTTATIEAALTVASQLTITTNLGGDVRMTTPSGSTVTVDAALPAGITIDRPAQGATTVTVTTTGDVALSHAAESTRWINVTLSATAATGILARQTDVVALLVAAAEVLAVTGGNIWVNVLLPTVAKVFASIAADETTVTVDYDAAARNLAPAVPDVDATQVGFDAIVQATRGVWLEQTFTANRVATISRQTFGLADSPVAVGIPAAVEGVMRNSAQSVTTASLPAAVHVEWKPIVPGVRTMMVSAGDRVYEVLADYRTVSIGRDGREYTSVLE